MNNDIDLMLRFQKGDDSCFEQLVERHKQRVFNIAYRYMGNTHDAEDIAQQVFMNIYRARNSYKPLCQFTTWLYAVCKNTCLKSFRKKRLKTVPLETETETNPDAVPEQRADPKALTPREHALNREQESAIREAIEALPGNQKILLLFYKYEHLSYEDIGKITGLSVQAVKSSLHRARLTLKEKLSKYFRNF
jgi:RNA polymerase sigma-70 factor (ECF subfamily)